MLPALTPNRYFCLMALASLELVLNLPLATYGLYLTASRSRIAPWVSWADTHADFFVIDQVPALFWRVDGHTQVTVELSRWAGIICALAFFAFFGFAAEARKHYRMVFWAVGKRLGFTPPKDNAFPSIRLPWSKAKPKPAVSFAVVSSSMGGKSLPCTPVKQRPDSLSPSLADSCTDYDFDDVTDGETDAHSMDIGEARVYTALAVVVLQRTRLRAAPTPCFSNFGAEGRQGAGSGGSRPLAGQRAGMGDVHSHIDADARRLMAVGESFLVSDVDVHLSALPRRVAVNFARSSTSTMESEIPDCIYNNFQTHVLSDDFARDHHGVERASKNSYSDVEVEPDREDDLDLGAGERIRGEPLPEVEVELKNKVDSEDLDLERLRRRWRPPSLRMLVLRYGVFRTGSRGTTRTCKDSNKYFAVTEVLGQTVQWNEFAFTHDKDRRSAEGERSTAEREGEEDVGGAQSTGEGKPTVNGGIRGSRRRGP
ncbi:pheromone A receptor-domain-containing protein [Mycena polygramma]|nr:pheromone A receptor-domain-containing protein [Mycena polygramma]